MNKVIAFIFGIFILLGIGGVLAAQNNNPQVSGNTATVCCEKTTSGLFCQDVPAEECASDSTQVPTACESTSYCRQGFCFDSSEGTCLDNTPQNVCNAEGGVWSEEKPAQCDLGCCVLGDQAAFVTLTRCKRLSGFLGLQTNYKKNIKDEVQCVLSVQNQDKGACVYDFEFDRTCKFTTREECTLGSGVNGTGVKGEFHVGKLCSAEELGTNCGPTRNTVCSPGKDEVYFIDTCGNPANIYDASKVSDKEYWSNVKDKSESCGLGSANANSQNCGSCNYLLGTFCRDAGTAGGSKPTYGDNICADLNCKSTQNGKSYKHGESWCIYNDEGTTGKGESSVGSRFFKHICINGEEVLEQCADFRQHECIEDKIETSQGDFAQAACRVNRWQDCTAQTEKIDCENSDRRDCFWQPGVEFQAKKTEDGKGKIQNGVCLPKDPPGLKFWGGGEAKGICSQGNAACIVSFEKGLFGGEKCIENCECLDEGWEKERSDICTALGDCGPKVNWVGQEGYKPGFKITKSGG